MKKEDFNILDTKPECNRICYIGFDNSDEVYVGYLTESGYLSVVKNGQTERIQNQNHTFYTPTYPKCMSFAFFMQNRTRGYYGFSVYPRGYNQHFYQNSNLPNDVIHMRLISAEWNTRNWDHRYNEPVYGYLLWLLSWYSTDHSNLIPNLDNCCDHLSIEDALADEVTQHNMTMIARRQIPSY